MSSAEIGDNKWELSASKPPIVSLSGLSSLFMMSGFAVFFGLLLAGAVMGIVTEKDEDGGLAGTYKNLGVEAMPAEE